MRFLSYFLLVTQGHKPEDVLKCISDFLRIHIP